MQNTTQGLPITVVIAIGGVPSCTNVCTSVRDIASFPDEIKLVVLSSEWKWSMTTFPACFLLQNECEETCWYSLMVRESENHTTDTSTLKPFSMGCPNCPVVKKNE